MTENTATAAEIQEAWEATVDGWMTKLKADGCDACKQGVDAHTFGADTDGRATMLCHPRDAMPTALSELAVRPMLLDEYPLNDDDARLNAWVREGDTLATLRASRDEENDEGEEETTEVDVYLNGEDLFELGMTAGRALRALGKRADLAELIKGLTDELFESA